MSDPWMAPEETRAAVPASRGQAALVCGILAVASLPACLVLNCVGLGLCVQIPGFVLAIVAVVMGWNPPEDPHGSTQARAGWLLGVVTIALNVVSCLIGIVYGIVLVATGNA